MEALLIVILTIDRLKRASYWFTAMARYLWFHHCHVGNCSNLSNQNKNNWKQKFTEWITGAIPDQWSRFLWTKQLNPYKKNIIMFASKSFDPLKLLDTLDFVLCIKLLFLNIKTFFTVIIYLDLNVHVDVNVFLFNWILLK